MSRYDPCAADDDPVNNHDPFGLSWLSACFGFGFTGPDADAFDEELSDDYWSGRMGMRAGAAAASELEVLAGVGEGLAGAKVAVGSAGALGAAGYVLAADGSSRIAGGAGHYLNLFDGGDRQWDAVGNAAYAAGGRYGRYTAVARDLAGAAGMAASLNRLANLASSAADAEAQAVLRQSQAASRLDSLTPPGVESALSPTGVIQNEIFGPSGPGQFMMIGDGELIYETQVAVLSKNYLANRVFHSGYRQGIGSRPIGMSFAPSGSLPANSTHAGINRGLNWPGVVNDAKYGVIVKTRGDTVVKYRRSLGGTDVEILFNDPKKEVIPIIDPVNLPPFAPALPGLH